MEKKQSKTPAGGGLELDRLEIPDRSSPNAVRKPTADPELKSTLFSDIGSFGKKRLWLTVTAVATTLVLLAALALFLKRQYLKVSFLALKNIAVSDSYLRVGPITATIKNDEVVRLSLDIECKNNSVKKRLAEKDPLIRDKIVSVITAPETGALLKNHQYEAIRAKIKENLKRIYGESIGEVYFAELLTY